MEQEHYGGKNDKRTKIIPSHRVIYMLNPMLYAILELILWHKYKKTRKKGKCKHSSIDQAP